LFAGLWRRRIFMPQPGWGGFSLRLALGLGAMVAWLLWIRFAVDWAGPARWSTHALLLAAIIAAAGAIYFAALWLLGFRPRDFVLRG
jgi:putative peptidoglycan lipid II flippase